MRDHAVGATALEDSEEFASKIRSSLSELNDRRRISVLPDYFVDRFVKVESIEELFRAIEKKAFEGGGGSLRGVRQIESKGGNAVNLAYALGKLGAHVKLFTIADLRAAATLGAIFHGMDRVEVKVIDGRVGLTLALEFPFRDRRVNVMVSDTGDLENFDGAHVPSEDWEKISDSTLTAVVNWSANKRGTELCERAFSLSKRKGHSTFFDPADVSARSSDIPILKERIFDRGLVDYVSVNDNELRILSKVTGDYSLPYDYILDEALKALKILAEETGATVDLHTRKISASCSGRETVVSTCRSVEQKMVTGAGDVWDAGDILGHVLGWDAQSRLRFANAAAGVYVSRENAEPPSTEEVLRFVLGPV